MYLFMYVCMCIHECKYWIATVILVQVRGIDAVSLR